MSVNCQLHAPAVSLPGIIASTFIIGSWLGPRAGLDVLEKTEVSLPHGDCLWSFRCPAGILRVRHIDCAVQVLAGKDGRIILGVLNANFVKMWGDGGGGGGFFSGGGRGGGGCGGGVKKPRGWEIGENFMKH